MRIICLVISYGLLGIWGYGQDFSGRWEGAIRQQNSDQAYPYRVDLTVENNQVNGRAISWNAGKTDSASFNVTGAWDGNKLILQEIRQLTGRKGAWCMKYAALQPQNVDGGTRLTGPWTADNCTPGEVTLFRRGPGAAPQPLVSTASSDPVSELEGQWTGQLYQDDRNYTFYFEMKLDPDGRGTSHIISEENQGSAIMEIDWRDMGDNSIVFTETGVLQKSDPDWPWCLKRGSLRGRKESDKYVLEGPWEGFIEGYVDVPRGRCAPGRIYLEKAIKTPESEAAKMNYAPYETEEGRTVKVMRIIKVQRPNIVIKVWDNSTVDGDVVTLFLNGSRILQDHRVTKRKSPIRVRLEEQENFLILHAVDLGEISPNTVAVSIDDGTREQVLILSSNLSESGAVLVRKIESN